MDIPWHDHVISEIRSAERIAVLGVGNPLKGDDGAGLTASEALKTRLAGTEMHRSALVISAGEVPENYTGVIRSFRPDLVIILDSAVSCGRPGTISIVDPSMIEDDEISTHRIPLVRLVEFIEATIPSRVILLGIEAVSFEENRGLSKKVRKSVTEIVKFLGKTLEEKTRT